MSPKKKRPSRLRNPLSLKEEVAQKPKGKALSRSSESVKSTGPFSFFKRRFKFSWKKFFITILALFGLLIVGIAGVFAYFIRDLPNPHALAAVPVVQSTQIVDRNGTPIYTIHGEENRTVVDSDQISPYVKEATVAIEDDTFYTNYGFDLKGIARAIGVRLHLVHGELGGGGSTITQQYIKLTLVGDDDTITRKIKELILAIEVDQTYSKDDILTGYLNQIPYGNTAYGIQAAAETYFGVSAKDLTLSEAATLAAIPNAPTYYSPYGNNTAELFVRKDYILDRMAAEGMITQAQANAAKTAAPSPTNLNFKEDSGLVAPHFTFYVEQQLVNYLDPSDPTEGQEMLDTGGYTVVTSLDLPTQEMAQNILSTMGPTEVKDYHATNACLTAVDPKTGQILAMVGSIDYNNSISGNTNFCAAQLQPGSSFKPFVYATAWSPPYTYSPSSITYDLKTDFGGGYSPNDYDLKNRGPVTDRDALGGSLNIPAVKNLALVGVQNAINTAQNLGISTLTQPASSYGLSLVLGSGSVEPVEMADAYATFANNGIYTPLEPILQIKQNGKVIKDFTTSNTSKKELSPEVAYEMNNVLSDASAKEPIFGSLTKYLTLPDRPVASKTGTTENYRDGWTIGYTPSIVAAVWVGNNNPNQTMVNGADGSVVAGPIWNKFMSEYLNGKPVQQFSVPSDMKTLTVDKLSGKLPTSQTPASDEITDIFAPWQVPTTSDDVHVQANIVKSSGLLATPLTPAADVETETFVNIHSEMPNNPAWEGPVDAWAKATFGAQYGSPPTQTDTTYTTANQPTVSFTSPTNGATVSGTFTIQADPGGTEPITQVDYSINNVQVGTATAAPWSISYDSSSLPPGTQTIEAIATNSLGLTQTTQIQVNTTQDTTAPGNVSGVTAINGSKLGGTPITLTWVNPSDSDLASVAIYQSTQAGQLGTKVQTVTVSPNTTSSATFTPAIGTYYYTLHPIDTSGNENSSVNQTQAKMGT